MRSCSVRKQSRFSQIAARSGFSLVQVMVAAALVALLSIVIGRIVTDMFRGSKTAQVMAANSDTANRVRMYLSKPTICPIAFKNATDGLLAVDADPKPVNFLKDDTGALIVDPSKVGVTLERVKTLPTGDFIYNLSLAFSKDPNIMGPAQAPIKIPMLVKLNTNLTIQSCGIQSESSASTAGNVDLSIASNGYSIQKLPDYCFKNNQGNGCAVSIVLTNKTDGSVKFMEAKILANPCTNCAEPGYWFTRQLDNGGLTTDFQDMLGGRSGDGNGVLINFGGGDLTLISNSRAANQGVPITTTQKTYDTWVFKTGSSWSADVSIRKR